MPQAPASVLIIDTDENLKLFLARPLPCYELLDPTERIAQKPIQSNNKTTEQWAPTHLAKIALAEAEGKKSDKVFKSYWEPFVKDMRMHSSDKVKFPGWTPASPSSAAPYTESSCVLAHNDVCLRPLFDHAFQNWFTFEDDYLYDLGVQALRFELLDENSASDHAGQAAAIRVDRVFSVGAIGDPQKSQTTGMRKEVHDLRSQTELQQAADKRSATLHDYLQVDRFWQAGGEAMFASRKTILPVEYKKYGALHWEYFDYLRRSKHAIGANPDQIQEVSALHARDCTEEVKKIVKQGAKNLQYILRQALHYCERYGKKEVILGDYQSTVLLVVPQNAIVNGQIDTSALQKKTHLWFMHIFNLVDQVKSEGITGSNLIACLLWRNISVFKGDLHTLRNTIIDKRKAEKDNAGGNNAGGDGTEGVAAQLAAMNIAPPTLQGGPSGDSEQQRGSSSAVPPDRSQERQQASSSGSRSAPQQGRSSQPQSSERQAASAPGNSSDSSGASGRARSGTARPGPWQKQ